MVAGVLKNFNNKQILMSRYLSTYLDTIFSRIDTVFKDGIPILGIKPTSLYDARSELANE